MRTLLSVLLILGVAAVVAATAAFDAPSPATPDPKAGADQPSTPPPATLRGAAPIDPREPVAVDETARGLPAPDTKVLTEADIPRTGSCRLELTLRIGPDERKLEGEVALWRLGLPETTGFTAGDELAASAKVGKDGRVHFENLVEGTYRLRIAGQRAHTEDLAAFEVRGATSTYAFDVPGRRSHHAFLRVVDERGEPLMAGAMEKGGLRIGYTEGAPSWVTQRAEKRDDGSIALSGGGAGAGFSGCGGAFPGRLVADERGFDLGARLEDSLMERVGSRVRVTFEGQSDVAWRLAHDAQGERTFLGVVVPPERVHAHVTMPDGLPAVDSGARFQIHCEPILVTDDTPADAWRRVPIKVKVLLDRYEKLEYTFTLDDEAPQHVMVFAKTP